MLTEEKSFDMIQNHFAGRRIFAGVFFAIAAFGQSAAGDRQVDSTAPGTSSPGTSHDALAHDGANRVVAASSSAAMGGVRGITRDPSGLPLPVVKVTVHGPDGSADKTTLSGADGAFSLDGLKPGRYQVTADKEGFAASPAAPVELAAAQSFNVDLTLAVARVPARRAATAISSSGLPRHTGTIGIPPLSAVLNPRSGGIRCRSQIRLFLLPFGRLAEPCGSATPTRLPTP
jgi:hypothetical protein